MDNMLLQIYAIWHSFRRVGIPCCLLDDKMIEHFNCYWLRPCVSKFIFSPEHTYCASSMPCTVLPVLMFFPLPRSPLPSPFSFLFQYSFPATYTIQVTSWRVRDHLLTITWFGVSLLFFHLTFLPSRWIFYQGIFMGCLLDCSDESSCCFSWSVRFWNFSQAYLFQLNLLTPITITRRRCHLGTRDAEEPS